MPCGRKPITKRNRAVVAMVRKGATYQEAADQFGMTRSAVAGVCNRAGLLVGRRTTEHFRAVNSAKMARMVEARRNDPKLHAEWLEKLTAGIRAAHARKRMTARSMKSEPLTRGGGIQTRNLNADTRPKVSRA